jgi:hypothetical protein
MQKPAVGGLQEGKLEGWLKGLIAGACVVVIAGGGYMGTATYSAYSERKEQEDASSSFARSQEISALATDGCRSRVDELMQIHSTAPISSKDDVPAKLSKDLTTCIQQKIMYPYEKSEMESANLLSMFST